MRDSIRVINDIDNLAAPNLILQKIVREANLTVDWISSQSESRFDQVLNGTVDTTTGLWVNTQQRLNANLTFSYPLMNFELVFLIPDPPANWSLSVPLAIFRVFSRQLWVVMIVMMSIFLTSIALTNMFTNWLR